MFLGVPLRNRRHVAQDRERLALHLIFQLVHRIERIARIEGSQPPLGVLGKSNTQQFLLPSNLLLRRNVEITQIDARKGTAVGLAVGVGKEARLT